MVKPIKTLLVLSLVFIYSGILLYFMPGSGISIGNFTIKYPTWKSFWAADSSAGNVAMDEFFDIYGLKNDIKAVQEKKEEERIFREKMRLFQTADESYQMFFPFFEAMATYPSEKRVRILHFGDSQIEGNRITGPIHNLFQAKYGGSGSGWLPVIETIPTNAAKQNQSDNWTKYAIYGNSNSNRHKKYGLLGSFSRFSEEFKALEKIVDDEENISETIKNIEPLNQEIIPEKVKHEAWFEIGPPARGASNLKKFSQARLAFGNFSDTVWYKVEANNQLIEEGFWNSSRELKLETWTFKTTPGTIRFSFQAHDSPDFYGISLESSKGVYVDNIAMRGSSGTIFNTMDLGLVKRQLGEDHVAMIMLQFGGNTIPYIKSEKQIEDYGKWFKSQLRNLKKYFPDAVFLVIGPSDMSTKVVDKFETYPFLPVVRDALKRAAFSEGAAFFDLYEAMGGKNSMTAWVNADPPLASTDYVHFAPSGSNMVASWLNSAFEQAETQYKNSIK